MKRAMRRRKTWQRQAAAITAAMMAMSVGGIAYAMPQGEVIRSGKGEITRQDKDMTVNQDSKRLAIDWSGFDIANDERVTFRQPDKDSVALNRVVGDAASVIDGTLSGNGHVYVINPNGVLFGKNASVDVGSLVASTARISDSDMTNFANADGITMAIPEDSLAKVINAGTIRAEGGLVVLHAAEVENSGTITNPEGTTALAAARNLSLSADTAGKINFTVDGALAKAKALNSGVLKADGGYLVMTARSAGDVMSTVVNNTGTMEAKTLRQNEKGEILLDGGDNGIVELNGTLDVSGMEAGQSAGSIKAIGAETHVEDGATLHAIGAVDGGLIETSGDYLEIGDNVDIDAAGKTGEAGEWLLDPLDVVISSEKPDNATNASGGPTYSLGNVTNASMTSWVDSATVNRLLSNGTSVRVESADRNKAASISVDSAIEKTGKREASFTLEAQRNITINKDITAQDGKLNVILNSDTDGDAIGAVIINADITTNGGYFTSGSGGDRHYTSYNSLVGAGNPSKGTVGTYFGNGGTTGNRSVTTNGGDVNLYGDVAIGLNGGTLTIDTAKANGTGGAVNITGTIESGNSYTLYYQGKAGWDDLVKKYATEHGVGRTATKYTGTGSKTISRGDIYCVISEDGLSVTWYKARKGSAVIGTTQYTDYTSSQVTVYDKYNDKAYDALSSTEKANLSHRIANSWEAAKWLAQNGTGGGSTVNDTYLATITSSLENSLAAPTGEIPLFVGGKGSGSSVNPADPDHSDGYYWVTGPEGEAPGGKGTKFADNSGTPLPNYYAKWHTGRSEASHSTTTEPNNSGPYVTVGYGVTSNWDDVATSAGTTKGFVQEKNLAHSGLEVQAGSGQVDLKGNAGLSVGLKNLTINTTGNVTVGGGKSAAGTTYTGQIRTDEGVSIHGADVTVGDRITSINNGVNIQATGNIHVDGITAHDKINLTTTGADGVIVLGSEHNDGSLNTASTENDAVIIDARGANGAFKNQTSAEHAITTGEGGNWKVYSASPDRDTFGTNLNSETTARWHASSQGGNGLDTYAGTENTNKYIFQVQPTLTITPDDKTKTYGDTVELTAQAKAEFVDKNGDRQDVTGFANAFQEVSEGGSIMDRYTGNYTLTSAGQAASATRTKGKYQADSDKELAVYDIEVKNDAENPLQGLEGYGIADLTNKGKLEITRRTVVLNGSASQTYGDATLKNKNVYAETGTEGQGLTNGDKLDTSGVEYTISDSGAYAASKNAHTNGVTADAGTYNDELLFSNVHFTNKADANYAVTGNGDITVDKHTITRDELGPEGSPLFETVYGTKPDDLGTATFNAVNGDGSYELNITGTNALTGNDTGRVTNDFGSDYYTTVALSDALSKNYKFDNGETSKDFEKTARVTRKQIELITDDITTTYGNGNKILAELNDNLLHLEGLTNGDEKDPGKILAELGAHITVENNKSAFKQKPDGTIMTDAVTGQHYTSNASSYSITTGAYLPDTTKNYEVVLGENAAGHTVGKINVKKAPLTVNRTGYETTYGTVITDDVAHRFTTWSGLVNGDVDDIYINYGNYGGAYKDNNTRTNNAGTYNFYKGLQSASNVLRNYEVNDTQKNWVKINPYALTDADISASYTTKYGSAYSFKKFGTAKLKNINGDGELDLMVVGSSALAPKSSGRVTQDAGENIYNTVVSLDAIYGADGFDLKNYTLNGKAIDKNTRMTIDNSASVKKATLKVNRKGHTTEYGTVLLEDAAHPFTTWGPLVNGDVDDIKVDNKNYGGAYLDNNTRTNNASDTPYTFKEALTSASNVLRNYTLDDTQSNSVTITPYTITSDDIVNGNPTFETVYGNKDKKLDVVINGVNGDGEIANTSTTTAYIYDEATGKPSKTNNVGNDYSITTVLNNTNYRFDNGTNTKLFEKSAKVTPATLKVNRTGYTTEYGTVILEDAAHPFTTWGPLVNGDVDDIKVDNKDYGGAYLDGNTRTNDASDTPYTFKEALTSESNVLRNYTLDDTGMNSVTITPYTITSKDIVNGNPEFSTVYGDTTTPVEVTIKGVNGDVTVANTATTSAYEYGTDGTPVKTKDAGDKIYDITSVLTNKNYQFENGESSKTFEKTASVTPAELTIKTKDVETEYGTVKTTTSEVEGLTNGDLPTGFIYDYGDYGGAYLDSNTKTNNVNTYHFGTEIKTMGKDGLVTPDFLKNYTITGGEADVKIDPKDVTFFVSGTGNTLDDITYTVDPDIDAQLAYGEHVDADYTPGNDLGSNQYGVVAHINGTPIVTGDVAGNYRYNYGGLITLSSTVPTKPDIDPHNPSNLDGSGSWTSNMGNHGVPGVERVAGLASAELPFFKVDAGQVSHYGTYDVAADPDKVRLEPTGKRLPEPNQPKTQYREYTKALTTTDGTGMFRMVYDGSTFNITPVDDGALALMRIGDVKNNVELSAEALHAGFSEMGILLEDLDGVYVHFDTMA